MRVRSPIGDLPFTVSAVRVEAGELVVDGELGAWPSQVRIEPSDAPALVRALPRPVLAAVGAALLLAALRAGRRR